MNRTLERLRNRKIFHWGAAYLAGAWVLLQALDLLAGQFEWPTPLMRAVTVVLGFGFLVALVLAWFHGERGAQRITPGELSLLLLLIALAGVSAFVVANRGAAAPRTGEPDRPRAAADRSSIAVLPFVNLSNDRENEYFSDGITEEILNVLTQVRGLHVAARTSSFAFKGQNIAVGRIADSLNVATVLQGSVRKAGTRVRIIAQLVNAQAGYQLWSQAYERDLVDVFAVQEEIARSIADALKVRLSPDAVPVIRGATSNPEAYDEYLKGLYHWNRRATESRQAIERFTNATQIDPNFGLAFAGLANAYSMMPMYTTEKPSATTPKARAAIRHALAVDSMMAEPWLTDAHIAFHYDRDIPKAEELMHRALTLGATTASAQQWHAEILEVSGRYDEALQEHARAVEADPLSPHTNSSYAEVLAVRDPQRAIERYRRALQLEPQMRAARGGLGLLLLRQGRWEEGSAELERIGDSRLVRSIVVGVRDRTRRGEALKSLDELGRGSSFTRMHRATLALLLHDQERALRILEEAAQQLDPALVFVRARPEFRVLAGDPRFQRLYPRN